MCRRLLQPPCQQEGTSEARDSCHHALYPARLIQPWSFTSARSYSLGSSGRSALFVVCFEGPFSSEVTCIHPTCSPARGITASAWTPATAFQWLSRRLSPPRGVLLPGSSSSAALIVPPPAHGATPPRPMLITCLSLPEHQLREEGDSVDFCSLHVSPVLRPMPDMKELSKYLILKDSILSSFPFANPVPLIICQTQLVFSSFYTLSYFVGWDAPHSHTF